METEVIDKLFLELSQVTKARTAQELRLAEALRETLEYIAHHDGTTISQRESDSRWKRWSELANASIERPMKPQEGR